MVRKVESLQVCKINNTDYKDCRVKIHKMCKVLDVKKRNYYSESQTMVKKRHKLFNKFLFFNTKSANNYMFACACPCFLVTLRAKQGQHRVLLFTDCVVRDPSLLDRWAQ